jgi:hypothetical protein
MIRFLMFLTGLTLTAVAFFWLVFGVIGLVGGILPWLVVALVIWRLSLLFRPRRDRWQRRRWREWQHQQRAWERPPRPAPMARPEPAEAGRLPLDVELKAAQIRRKVEVLQQHAREFPFGSEQLYIVRAIAADYLPHTLDAYLALPPRGRERVLVSDGRTALEELRDQLRLLDTKLDEIAEDLERRNLDRLLANRRFLEERFRADGDRAVAV